MRKVFILSGIVLLSCKPMAQNVGIGVANPQSRLSLDSSILIDQNNVGTTGLQPGLIFGSDMKTGISSNKNPGSATRSGLNFITSNQRRMIIDSIGNVGINGTPIGGYRLAVSGSMYAYNTLIDGNLDVNFDANIFGRLNINTSGNNAALHIKGQSGTLDNWGQHIVMESTTTANHGNILYDEDGMKFRTFGLTDNFYFRNSDNNTRMLLTPEGNLTIDGTMTLNGGRGAVHNATSSDNLRVYPFTTGTFTVNLPAHGSVQGTIAFGGGFTAEPTVFVGNIHSWGGPSGEPNRVIMVLHGCTYSAGTTTCLAKLINTDDAAVNYDIRWNCLAIGN